MIRDIDLEAPVVYGHTEENLRRLVRAKMETDSSHHNNDTIKM